MLIEIAWLCCTAEASQDPQLPARFGLARVTPMPRMEVRLGALEVEAFVANTIQDDS